MGPYLLLGFFLLCIWATSWQLEKSVFKGQTLVSLNYTWFAASWLPGIFLLSLPIYVFPERFSAEDAVYLASVHGLFAFGSLVGLLCRGKMRQSPRLFPFTKNTILFFILIGIAAQILNGVDSLLSGAMSFSDRLSVANLADLKNQYQNYDQSKTFLGPLAGLVRYLIGIGQIGILAYSYGRANKLIASSRLLKSSLILLVAISCFNSWFITAGRLGIIITFLFLLIPRTLALSKKENKKLNGARPRRWPYYFIAGFAALSSIYYLSTTFLVGRLGKADALHALNAVHRATIAPEIASIVYNDAALQVLIFQASYLSNPIPTAAFYINHKPNDLPGPRWGAINFSLEVAFFQKILGISNSKAGDANQYDVEGPLLRAGYYGGVWSTMVRELIIDFGRNGVLAFFFLFGLASGLLQGSMIRRPTIPKAIFFSLLRIQMLWSGFHSLLYHQLFSYAFFISFIILLISAFRDSRQNTISRLAKNSAP